MLVSGRVYILLFAAYIHMYIRIILYITRCPNIMEVENSPFGGKKNSCRSASWRTTDHPDPHFPLPWWFGGRVYGGFLKWWYPTTMGFPTKNDHFGVFCGYHHLRKHPSKHLFFWMVSANGLEPVGSFLLRSPIQSREMPRFESPVCTKWPFARINELSNEK